MQDQNKMISSTFDWYLTEIMPIVSQNAIQQKYGYHGLYTHTAAVVFRGIDYALALGQKPGAVVLACAFHDMARTHDYDDAEHGRNALPVARRIMGQMGNIAPETQKSILYAIENHSFNLTAPDYISACLWDADRTRLAWDLGYDPRFFATNRAKLVASRNPDEYIAFMRRNMSQYAQRIITNIGKAY